MRIATFNVQNLRRREAAGVIHYDGARDEVLALSKLSEADRALDAQDRALTAKLIAHAAPDVLVLQEVFDQQTLDGFHDAYLAPLGLALPHRVCVPGNDGRRRVALMSRLPLDAVKSHADLTYDDIGLSPPLGDSAQARVFRRDCLTATCGGVLILAVHFKAPADEASLAVVRSEALAVRTLIERKFADPAAASWAAVGDFNVNDAPSGDVLAPLTQSFGVDPALALPPSERWTYFHPARHSYARPDRMLLSPALAPRCTAFEIHRQGMSRAASGDARFDGVGLIRPRASDHALLAVDLQD